MNVLVFKHFCPNLFFNFSQLRPATFASWENSHEFPSLASSSRYVVPQQTDPK